MSSRFYRSKKPKKRQDLRPLTARLAKSLGDTLRPYLSGARVLDLFSGEGRFGEIALKEGAQSVTFVESDPKQAQKLKKRYPQSKVFAGDAFVFAGSCGGEHFDVVAVDPPFGIWEQAFQDRLVEIFPKLVAPQGIFLVRYPSRVILSEAVFDLREWKRTVYGEATVLFLKNDAGE